MRLHSPLIFDLMSKSIDKKAHQKRMKRYNTFVKNHDKSVSYRSIGAKEHLVNTTLYEVYRRTKLGSIDQNIINQISFYFNSQEILEFGTSFGCSTLALKSDTNKITTVDGLEIGTEILKEFLALENISNIQCITSDFDTFMSHFSFEPYTLFYLDGNHRYNPTMRYVKNFIQAKISKEDSFIIILDDIRYSREMWTAWHELSADQNINYILDFGKIGVLMRHSHRVAKQYYYLWPMFG
jgi:predicted O-methyltransferase YrrM